MKEVLQKVIQAVCTIDDSQMNFGTPASLNLDGNLVKECKMLMKQSKIICANF